MNLGRASTSTDEANPGPAGSGAVAVLEVLVRVWVLLGSDSSGFSLLTFFFLVFTACCFKVCDSCVIGVTQLSQTLKIQIYKHILIIHVLLY